MLGVDRSGRSSWLNFGVAAIAALGLLLAAVPAEAKKKKKPPAPAAEREDEGRGACSHSASALHSACRLEAQQDQFEARAICLNLADAEERAECLDEASAARGAKAEECKEQRDARRALCEKLGEAPYEPDMDPALFQDPRNPSRPNPWFPLDVGSRWVFDEGDERVEIEVLDETKRIGGVDCIVVNDKAFEDGVLVEDTDDWFGLRADSSVEYCGELARDYEVFDGDDPEEPQLVDIGGSFKAGVDGAKSGTLMMGAPVVGTTYRQEWAAGDAEDVGTVLSTTYRYGESAFLDQAVPQALADLFCANGDCVVVADTSTLEPSAYEHKFFARGVGLFLETKPRLGRFVPLAACSHDARCAQLPLP
jgi:hypothetical protein